MHIARCWPPWRWLNVSVMLHAFCVPGASAHAGGAGKADKPARGKQLLFQQVLVSDFTGCGGGRWHRLLPPDRSTIHQRAET
jgi:hypothetical protein